MSVMIRLLEQRFFSKIALGCFLLTLPLSIRKVLFVFFPYGTSGFNEYTDISLYLSDLTLGIFLSFIIIENKNTLLSIIWWRELFHVEQIQNYDNQSKNVPRGTLKSIFNFFRYKCSTWNNISHFILLPLPFLIWTASSTFWSENETLAFYATIKLFEGYFLYLGLIFMTVPRGTLEKLDDSELKNLKCSTWNNQEESYENTKLFHVEQLESENKENSLCIKNVPRGTMESLFAILSKECSMWNILNFTSGTLIFAGFIQSLIAIGQFISQSSLQLTFLWESQLSASQAGIAKIIYFDQVFIRAYGLFPHPNILAAFLAITIILTLRQSFLLGQKMFHVEQSDLSTENVPRGTFSMLLNTFLNWTRLVCSTWNNREFLPCCKTMFHVEHSMIFSKIALIIQVFGFLLTFSKGAFLGLSLALLYIFYKIISVRSLPLMANNVPRGTLNKNNIVDVQKCSTWNNWVDRLKLFHVEQIPSYSKIFIFAVIIGIFASMINWHFFLLQPIKERFFLQQWAYSLFRENPIWGSGIGQSVLLMQNFSPESLEAWQFQPVHNLFFLVSTELGILGCLLFFLLLLGIARKMFHVEHMKRTILESTDIHFFAGLGILILVTSLFDHYYWDIQQGQLLFWLVLGLMVIQTLPKKYLTKYI